MISIARLAYHLRDRAADCLLDVRGDGIEVYDAGGTYLDFVPIQPEDEPIPAEPTPNIEDDEPDPPDGRVEEPAYDDGGKGILAPPGVLWAEQHAGEMRKRPRGQVIYTVIGEGDGNGYGGVKVKRSSDGRIAGSSIYEMERMVVVGHDSEYVR